jgi:hypothetical protein
MGKTCSPEQLKRYTQTIEDKITQLTDLWELGYKVDPIEDVDIQSTINSLRKLKADKIVEAREAMEQNHPVGLINSGKIRYGKQVAVEVIRWVTKNGKDEFTVQFDGYVKKVPYITIDDMNPVDYVNKYSNGLGSAAEMKKKIRNLEKEYVDLGKEMWKDQNAVLKLFDRMVANEGAKTTHTKQLRKVLEKITDPQNQYLNEFKIYMKEGAESNGGVAVAYESGKAGKIILDIKEGSTANPNEMSAAEVFVHEMVHMAVETARTYKQGPLAGVISEMLTIHEHARKNITPEQIGQKMWDYVFKDENALSEFIAHSMTNEKLMKLLKDMELPTKKERNLDSSSWFDKLIDQVIKLYDSLRELVLKQRKEKTMDSRIGYLATRMMEHNNMSKEATWLDEKLRFIGDAKEVANVKIIDGIVGVAKFAGESFDMIHKYADGGVIGQAFTVTDGIMSAINPWPTEKQRLTWELTRKNLNKVFASIGMDQTFAPEGQITKLWEHIRNKDDSLKQKIEHYLLMNQQIDKKREDTIGTIAGKIAADLKGVSKTEMASITRAILEIDMKALTGYYIIEQMQKMLESDENVDIELAKEYAKLDDIIKDNKKATTFYKSQAKGLGYYMATGVSGKAVYKNANRIMNAGAVTFNLMNSEGRMKDVKTVEQIIDRIATIEGIRYSAKTDRDVAAKVMATHEEGIANIMYLQAQVEHKNKALAAKNKTYSYPDKGEIKEIIPSYMNTRVNFDDEITQKKMKKLGFKKVGDSGAKGIAVYMRPISDLGAFDKQAVAKISMGKRLHSIDTMHNLTGQDIAVETAEAIQEIAEDARKEMLELANEVKLPTMDGFNMQVVNGEIVNYGVSISKETMETSLKQKKRVDEIIGKMFAETQEKEMAQELNKKVWDEIIRDQTANYSRRGNMDYKKEYIEIGPNAKHDTDGAKEYAQNVWDNLPQDIRTKINKLGKDKQYIAVRRDLTDLYFGRRAPSLLRVKIPFMDVTAEDQLRKVGAGFIADGLMLAGELWQEMVALQKIDIVLRTPGVIIGNISSNINLAIALGQSPWAALTQTINMTKSTKQYLDNEKKLRRLVLDYRLERNSDKKVGLKREIDSIKNELQENPVYDLMKAGMFTTIMEDVNTRDLVQKSRLEEGAQKFTQYIPKVIKDTASALWVTEDTKLFQALAMTVQYSDFVARANRYHVLLARGMSKQEAIKYVLDEQGNYGINLGGFMTWIDKMGGWRFPKYTVIANKVMIQRVKTDPIAAATLAFTGVESPINAVALFKNWDYALLNPVESAWDLTKKHIIPPTALEYVGLIK